MKALGSAIPPFRGCLQVALYNAKTGEEVFKTRNLNSLGTQGLAWLWQHALSGHSASDQFLGFLAVGSGTNAPATGDTALVGELARIAVSNWNTAGMTDSTGPYFVAEATFATDEANGTIAEGGLFNASATGTMIARATLSATTEKTTDYTMGVSYTITQNVT